MKRIRIIGLCLVAVFAMSAVAVSSASAAKTKKAKPGLKFSTAAGPVVAGTKVLAFSNNLITTTELGKLECTENTMTITLTEVGGKKNKASLTEEVSEGAEPLKSCKTTTPAGPAKITTQKKPWASEFKLKGTEGENVLNSVQFTSEFFGAPGAPKCVFTGKKMKSKFKVGAEGSPIPLELTTTAQKLSLEKAGSNEICPKKGTTIAGTFTVKTEVGGETVKVEL
jgi:hypothetical protein